MLGVILECKKSERSTEKYQITKTFMQYAQNTSLVKYLEFVQILRNALKSTNLALLKIEEKVVRALLLQS